MQHLHMRRITKLCKAVLISWLAVGYSLAPERAFAEQTGVRSTVQNDPSPPAVVTEPPTVTQDAVSVPISIEDGIVVVNAMLDGSGPFPMVVDTGSVGIITPQVVTALGLKIENSSLIEGAAERTLAVTSTRVGEVRLGEAKVHQQPFLVLNLPRAMTDRGPRPPIVGILGYELFANFVIRLDYQQSLLTFTTPLNFRYSGSGVCVPFLFRGKLPSVAASADGVEGLFAIDIGSDAALVFERSFVERNSLEKRHPAVIKIKSSAVDGLYETAVTRIDSFDIARTAILRPLSQYPLGQNKGLPIAGVAGSIGSRIVRQFVITFDYSRHELWFEQSPVFGIKTAGGTTGFQVVKSEGPNFNVVNVIVNTPASEAGVQVGDVVTEVNGILAKELGRADFSELMRRPGGTAIYLRLVRNGTERVLAMTPKELVP